VKELRTMLNNIPGFMKRSIQNTILLLTISLFTSCLMLPCALYHHFQAANVDGENILELEVISLPKQKIYKVTNIPPASQVYIKSAIFDKPNEFYSMETGQSDEAGRQFRFKISDRKFYKSGVFKYVTLKVVDKDSKEEIFEYSEIVK